jgi:hypothetical protein
MKYENKPARQSRFIFPLSSFRFCVHESFLAAC